MALPWAAMAAFSLVLPTLISSSLSLLVLVGAAADTPLKVSTIVVG